jgi:Holliday junction resolvase RusA-like endonuclease
MAKLLALEAYRDSLFSTTGDYPWGSVPIRISATFYTHQSPLTAGRYRPRDCDNALRSIKPVLDGIKDAGLVKDDGAKWVSIGEIKIISSKTDKLSNGEPRVVLTVEQVEP